MRMTQSQISDHSDHQHNSVSGFLDWKKYYTSSKPIDQYSCRSIEYRYGSLNYDSGHDPSAPVTAVIINFHDGMSRMILTG